MKQLIHTQPDFAALIARIGLGLFILPHGLQKAFGLFGGPGIDGTVGMMGQNLGIPALLAYLAIAAEFLGGLGLILGFLSRVSAFGVAVVLGVAVAMVHWNEGFLGGQGAGGWQMHFLGLALALIVMVRGGGTASVDLALSHPVRNPEPTTHLGTPTRA